MKHLITLLIILRLGACASDKGGAGGGNKGGEIDVGNGGDSLALEFIKRGRYVVLMLETNQQNAGLLSAAEIADFKAIIEVTRIVVVDHELTDSNAAPVMALTSEDPINSNKRWVRLNVGRWKEALKSPLNLNQTVFHEYLWVLGKDDTNYGISSKLQAPESDYKIYRANIQKSGLPTS